MARALLHNPLPLPSFCPIQPRSDVPDCPVVAASNKDVKEIRCAQQRIAHPLEFIHHFPIHYFFPLL